MEEGAEEPVAFERVRAGVKNVPVPELVDRPGRAQRRAREHHVQAQEAPVVRLAEVDEVLRPGLAVIGLADLQAQEAEVDLVDGGRCRGEVDAWLHDRSFPVSTNRDDRISGHPDTCGTVVTPCRRSGGPPTASTAGSAAARASRSGAYRCRIRPLRPERQTPTAPVLPSTLPLPPPITFMIRRLPETGGSS